MLVIFAVVVDCGINNDVFFYECFDSPKLRSFVFPLQIVLDNFLVFHWTCIVFYSVNHMVFITQLSNEPSFCSRIDVVHSMVMVKVEFILKLKYE